MAFTIIPGDTIAPKYSPFNVIDVAYKQVRGNLILASILIPRHLNVKTVPIAVHWHGGGLIVGHRLFPDWHADWTLELALKHNAVIVSPDYRLLPEAKGIDQYEDMKDFYAWLLKPGNLIQYLPDQVEPDLDHLLITGESAGGWFAVQSGFVIPDNISAVVAHYAMLDLKSPHFVDDYHKDLFDPPAPQLDRKILQDHLDNLTGDEVVSGRNPPEGVPLLLVAFQSGQFDSLFGPQTELYPFEQLQRASGFPRLWLVHGDQDNVVPVECSEKFAKRFSEHLSKVPLHVSIRAGESHGFDVHEAATGLPATLESNWVKSGAAFVNEVWPRQNGI